MHRGKNAFFLQRHRPFSGSIYFFLRACSPGAFVINSEQRLTNKKVGSVVFRKFMSVIFHAPRILTRRARS